MLFLEMCKQTAVKLLAMLTAPSMGTVPSRTTHLSPV